MWDTNRTLWGSFLIDSPEGRIFFAGDSAYGKHFKHLYEKYGAPKLSLLPPGGQVKVLHLWPGQTPPGDARGRLMFTHSQLAWQPELRPL